MFHKIIVPLDGSPLSEMALPYAVNLARLSNADLVLMRVLTEHPKGVNVHYKTDHEIPTPAVANIEIEPSIFGVIRTETVNVVETVRMPSEDFDEVESYLINLKKTLVAVTDLKIWQVRTLVIADYTPEEIAHVAETQGADLIVVSTHGRTGFAKLLMGSVATKILQHSNIPVILVRPKNFGEAYSLTEMLRAVTDPVSGDKRVVLALDGTVEAEKAIKPAVELAKLLGATVYLLRVVQLVVPADYALQYYGYVYTPEKELDKLRNTAYHYLEAVQARIAEQGVSCVKVVREGNPVDEIARWACETHSTFLVMASHARGRVGQFLLGSVADSVLHQSYMPVMLVHRN
jgi:nucleotide-binding universal stress UspA family protein